MTTSNSSAVFISHTIVKPISTELPTVSSASSSHLFNLELFPEKQALKNHIDCIEEENQSYILGYN